MAPGNSQGVGRASRQKGAGLENRGESTSAFAASLGMTDAHDHALGIDVADVQMGGFAQPQASRVAGHEQGHDTWA